MASAISRRLFLKLSSFAGVMCLPIFGCKKRRVAASVAPAASGTGEDLVRLADKVGPIVFGTPIVLCGSIVKDRPNFNLLGNFGIVSLGPPKQVVYISSKAKHFTNIGIREHGEFSVSFPHAGILAKADYCGVCSGFNIDKSTIFNVQYGTLRFAPLIKECNVCFGCRVVFQTKVNDMDVFFGEIVDKYAKIECINNGKPNPDTIKAVTFGPGGAYRPVGEKIGTPWSEYQKYSG